MLKKKTKNKNVSYLQIIGRKNVCGTSVAATSKVIPKSTIRSANRRHLLISALNLEDAKELKSKLVIWFPGETTYVYK
jgi:hypothetical protein